MGIGYNLNILFNISWVWLNYMFIITSQPTVHWQQNTQQACSASEIEQNNEQKKPETKQKRKWSILRLQ